MDWTIFQSHHTDNEEKPSLEENAQAALVVKITAASAGDVRDVGSIPGSGRSPGGGHGNPLQYSFCKKIYLFNWRLITLQSCPLQYSCLENPHG